MNTKDYIYLDEDLLNSHLAQFEKGLMVKETSEHGFEDSDSISGSHGTTLGVNGIFGIGAKLQNEFTEGDSSLSTELTKNIMENVLNDYAVDLLIQDCNENGLLCDFGSASDGDFISYCSEFQIYDFGYLKEITNPEYLTPILSAGSPKTPRANATKKERTAYLLEDTELNKAKNGYQKIYDFSVYADKIFEDSALVKLDKGLAICKRNKLRLNKAQVSFENETNRKIKVFGVVSTVKAKTYQKGDPLNFKANELDKVSSLVMDILLSSFHMLHAGDKIIKPIAIYFEAD